MQRFLIPHFSSSMGDMNVEGSLKHNLVIELLACNTVQSTTDGYQLTRWK